MPHLPHSVKAASVATPDGNYIVLNTQYGNLSQRFSIAHELIHLVYNEPPVEQQSEFYHDMVELKANAGAAELLLPYEWFTAEAARRLGEPLGSLEDLKVYLATPDARAWAGLARVSRAVLGRHLLDHNWVRRPERSVHVG